MRLAILLFVLVTASACSLFNGGTVGFEGPLADHARAITRDVRSCVAVDGRVTIEHRPVSRVCALIAEGATVFITLGMGDTVLSLSREWRPGPAHLDSVASLSRRLLATTFAGALPCHSEGAGTLLRLQSAGFVAVLEIDSIFGRVGEYRSLGRSETCDLAVDAAPDSAMMRAR